MLRPGDLAPPFRVQPVFGLPVQTGGRPLVVLFLRSLSGGLARAAVVEAQKALVTLDTAGVGLVAFTRCDLTLARDYVPREHVLFPIVVEETDARFVAWGVGRDRGLGRSLLGLRPAGIRAAASSLGLGRGRPEGGVDQLPAEFVVGRNGRVVHARYGRTIFDLPDVAALCAAACRE